MESKSHLSVETIKAYKRILNKFHEYIYNNNFGDILEIDKRIYEGFIMELENRNLKINSINRYISVINNYFIYLYKNGYIKNEIKYQSIEKKNINKNNKIITKSEFEKITSKIEKEFKNFGKYILILKFLFYTELKLKEILKLRWSDIKEDFQFVEIDNKSVSLSKEIVLSIKDFYKEEKKDHVFLNYKGTILSRQSVWRAFKRINKKFSIKITAEVLNRSYKINKILESYDKEEI